MHKFGAMILLIMQICFMLYADTSIKLPVNDDLGFVIGVQGAIQGQNSDGNILNNNGYGNSVSSNMLGASLDFNYSIFGLQLGYNNIWGPSDGYEAGGLISPYTYQYATDPLYTTGWMQGMESVHLDMHINLLRRCQS